MKLNQDHVGIFHLKNPLLEKENHGKISHGTSLLTNGNVTSHTTCTPTCISHTSSSGNPVNSSRQAQTPQFADVDACPLY